LSSGNVLDRRVRDGVTMSTRWPSPTAQSAPDIATLVNRSLVKRAQRRREQQEFRAWLAITAKPPW
jgi:hypothetical protein